MEALITGLQNFAREEDGAAMVEYGLLVALIAVICVAAISSIGTSLNTAYTHVADCLKDHTKC